MKKIYFISIMFMFVLIMGRAGATAPVAVVDGDKSTYELVNFVTDGDDPGLQMGDRDQNESVYLTVGETFEITVINATVFDREIYNSDGDRSIIPDSIELEMQIDDYHYNFFNQIYQGYIITTDLQIIDDVYASFPGMYNLTETDETVILGTSIDDPDAITNHDREIIYDKETGWMLEHVFTFKRDGITTSAEIRSTGVGLNVFGILQFELPVFVLTGLSIVMLKRFRPKGNN